MSEPLDFSKLKFGEIGVAVGSDPDFVPDLGDEGRYISESVSRQGNPTAMLVQVQWYISSDKGSPGSTYTYIGRSYEKWDTQIAPYPPKMWFDCDFMNRLENQDYSVIMRIKRDPRIPGWTHNLKTIPDDEANQWHRVVGRYRPDLLVSKTVEVLDKKTIRYTDLKGNFWLWRLDEESDEPNEHNEILGEWKD